MNELTKDTIFQILTAFREESLRNYLQQDSQYQSLSDRMDAAEAAVENMQMPEDIRKVIQEMEEAKREIQERELTLSYMAGIGDCLDFLRKHKLLDMTIFNQD